MQGWMHKITHRGIKNCWDCRRYDSSAWGWMRHWAMDGASEERIRCLWFTLMELIGPTKRNLRGLCLFPIGKTFQEYILEKHVYLAGGWAMQSSQAWVNKFLDFNPWLRRPEIQDGMNLFFPPSFARTNLGFFSFGLCAAPVSNNTLTSSMVHCWDRQNDVYIKESTPWTILIGGLAQRNNLPVLVAPWQVNCLGRQGLLVWGRNMTPLRTGSVIFSVCRDKESQNRDSLKERSWHLQVWRVPWMSVGCWQLFFMSYMSARVKGCT